MYTGITNSCRFVFELRRGTTTPTAWQQWKHWMVFVSVCVCVLYTFGTRWIRRDETHESRMFKKKNGTWIVNWKESRRMANNKVLYAKFFVSFPISFATQKKIGSLVRWVLATFHFVARQEKTNRHWCHQIKHTHIIFFSLGWNQTNGKHSLRDSNKKRYRRKKNYQNFRLFSGEFILYSFLFRRSQGRSHSVSPIFFFSITRVRSKILWNVLQYLCSPKSLAAVYLFN